MKQHQVFGGFVLTINTHTIAKKAGKQRITLLPLMLFLLMIKVDVGWGQATCGSISQNIAYNINGSGQKTVYVNWVRVLNDNCTDGISHSLANQVINETELVFGNIGIELVRTSCSASPDQINTKCLSSLVSPASVCDFFTHCTDNVLNVFLIPQNGSLNGNLGQGMLPGAVCVSKVGSLSSVKTIVHEIGHCFGLIHTHGTKDWWVPIGGGNNWWSCNSQGGVTGQVADPGCAGVPMFIPFENVNGSNAATSGDFVVDTPADIGVGSLNGCGPKSSSNCATNSKCQDALEDDNRRKDPNCDVYSIDWTNVMRFQDNECVSTELTQGQISRMKGVLEQHLQNIQIGHPVSNDFCSPCHAGHEHLNLTEINGVVDITEPTLITKDLTINVNSVLNVNSDLYVAPGKRIYVNSGASLNVLQTGHITACGSNWVMIQANPNSSVSVNGGKISKATTGILAIGANKIELNYADFIDNTVDVNFLGNVNNATFSNSRFFGSEYGVGILGQRDQPYIFNNCTFAYQSQSGISTNYAASIVVNDNCQFIGCNHGVSLSNLFSQSSQNSLGLWTSIPNQFINCYNGIYAVNSNTAAEHNYFSGNNYGLVFRGLNVFKSGFNTYSGNGYAELIDGTVNENHSYYNQYSSDVGIYPHNSNNGYTFYNNCFGTMWWDVDAHGVLPDQVLGDVAMENCFTAPNDFLCNTNPIYYAVPGGPSIPPCKIPDNSGQTFTNLTKRPQDEVLPCGYGAGPVDNQFSYLVRMGCDFKRLKKSIDSLQAIVKAIKALPVGSNSPANRIRLSVAERHLRFAIKQWAWCLRREKKFRELKEWYMEWSKEYPNDKYFALEVAAATTNLKNYTLAKAEIDSITLVHGIHIEISASIKMSIDVLALDDSRYDVQESASLPISVVEVAYHQSAYTLTPEGYQLLRRVAQMTAPEAAYGRALLSYLTGEMIDPDHTRPVSWRKKHDITTPTPPEQYSMYPNPASDQFTLALTNVDPRAEYRYEVIDMMGKTVTQGEVLTETKISTIDIMSGVYTLRILKNGASVHLKKLIIQK